MKYTVFNAKTFFFISGQSVDPNKEKIGAKLDKDFRTKQLIRDALMDNDFLKNLSSGQIREVIDFMQVKKIAAGTYVRAYDFFPHHFPIEILN